MPDSQKSEFPDLLPSPSVSALACRAEVADDINSELSVLRSTQRNNCISSWLFTISNCPLHFERIYCSAVKTQRAKPRGEAVIAGRALQCNSLSPLDSRGIARSRCRNFVYFLHFFFLVLRNNPQKYLLIGERRDD